MRITARLYGTAGSVDDTLESEMLETVKILATADVQLTLQPCEGWRPGDDSNPCARPMIGGEFAVRTYRSDVRKNDPHEHALGYSLFDPETGHGSLVTIDLSAVDWLAEASDANARLLVGRVAAHEIGHLLLGSGDHSRAGLMRSVWSARSLRQARSNDWTFTGREVALIHATSVTHPVRFASRPLMAALRGRQSTD